MTAPSATPEIGVAVQTGAILTNLHDQGAGEPVLMIHGSGPGVSAWANWRLVLPPLAERFRVIAPDMAGFGYTQAPTDTDYRPALWVRQLVDLLDVLDLSGVNVVGNSFGGAIALHLAHRHPDRVKRLVLMGSCGASFPLTPGLDKVWGYEPSLQAMTELLKIFAYDHSILTEDLAQMRYRASIRDDVQQRFAALFPAPRQRWIEALALDEASLRAIRQPTLLVHGKDDQVIPLAASERLAALLPNARLEALDHCGHWVQIERTQAFLDLVRTFLADNAAWGSAQ